MERKLPAITWGVLRSLGNSGAVRLSAAFPFVGFWILFNDQVSAFLHMSTLDSTSSKSGLLGLVDTIWRQKIYFVYFGLFLLGAGSTLYQVFCPYVIKKHADWSDYVRVDGEVMGSKSVEALAEVLGYDRSHQIRFLPLNEQRPLIMQQWYADQSYEKPCWRLMTAVLFGTGLLLLSVPTTLSLIKVSQLLIR